MRIRTAFHMSLTGRECDLRSMRGKSNPHLFQGSRQFLSIHMKKRMQGVCPTIRLIARARSFVGIEGGFGIFSRGWDGLIKNIKFEI